jgi:hypothetical protein
MDSQLARAVANSLWPQLKRQRWQTHTVTRNLSSYNPRGYSARPQAGSVATTPAASATVVLHEEAFIACLLLREEYDGPTSYAIHLDYDRYHLTITLFGRALATAYGELISHATCRQPFTRQLNRHGVPKLRRNPHELTMTLPASTALERIAATCTLRALDEENVDEFLIIDTDVPDELMLALQQTAPARGLML